MPEPAAIVLTGGRSSRMGRDKASLVVNGATMLDRVLGALSEAGVAQVVVAGPTGVNDPEPYQGPLAGIVSAWNVLAESSPDPVVVLSCDLPGLTSDVIEGLLGAVARSSHSAVAHDGERSQPLIAAYRPELLDQMRKRFELGERSVWVCLLNHPVDEVTFALTVIADADTPPDLDGYDVEWGDNQKNDHDNTEVDG